MGFCVVDCGCGMEGSRFGVPCSGLKLPPNLRAKRHRGWGCAPGLWDLIIYMGLNLITCIILGFLIRIMVYWAKNPRLTVKAPIAGSGFRVSWMAWGVAREALMNPEEHRDLNP